MENIACSGVARPNTGIGVVQKYLYPRLTEELGSLEHSPKRDLGRSVPQRILGLINGLRPPKKGYSAYLSVVPPLPFGLRGRVVTIVHDLRWMRTRSSLGRWYRLWDLGRSVSRSDSLVCISQRTYEDLLSVFPKAKSKTVVSWLGPGLVPPGSFHPTESGNLLLIGGARHKANESAAKILAEARPGWLKSITGIGVSPEVRATIDEAFGENFGTWTSNVSDEEIVSAYRTAQFFMLLGRDEGFGLPFVEALAAGCQVISLDQPLTRELFGPACTYLPESLEQCRSILQSKPDISPELRLEALSRFDWSKFADSVAGQLAPASLSGH